MDNTIGKEEVRKEVIDAYHEVMNQLKVMNNGNPDEVQVEEEENNQVKAALMDFASKETVDELAKKLAELKMTVIKNIDDIKVKLTSEYEKFYTLQQAIHICKDELSHLYDIKANANTLSALILAQKEKTETFERDMSERKRTFENEKMQLEKERLRDQNEYVQKRDYMRKRDQEQYEIDKRALYQELLDSRRALEDEFEAREAGLAARENEHQQLKEREARILAREQEFAQLKEKELRFPEEMRIALHKAEIAVTERLTREHEYSMKLSQIELDSERKMYQQKIESMEQQIEQYKKLKELFATA